MNNETADLLLDDAMHFLAISSHILVFA